MTLKLKLNVGGANSGDNALNSGSPQPPAALLALPAAPLPSLPKIKIKRPKPPPSDAQKPTKKLKISLGGAKKLPIPSATPKQRLAKPATPGSQLPRVRIKPTRVPGDGYDLEAPDIEEDPLIEQGMMIRFLDDTNLEFVQSAVELGDYLGLNIKWILKDKAVVNVNGTLYSARVVDLPTVTEIFKTTDRKNIFKTLDVLQMLLVLKKVDPENLRKDKDFEVPPEKMYHHPLFKMAVNKEFKEQKYVWRDGLLPPFENVFRRFRPRKLNHRVMDAVDARVAELIKRDENADELLFEVVDPKASLGMYQTPLGATPSTNQTPGAMATPYNYGQSTPRGWAHLATPLAAGTPMVVDDEDEFEGVNLEEELNKVLDGDDEMFGDELGDLVDQQPPEELDESPDDDSDDEPGSNQHAKMLEEEIADLEQAVELNKRRLDLATLRMMRMKFQNTYNLLKGSLDHKKRALAKILEEERKHDPTQHQGALALAAAAAAAAGVQQVEALDEDGEDGEDGDDGDEGDDGDDGDDGDNDIDDLF